VKFKNVVAQFIGLPHLSLRGWRSQPKQSRKGYEIATHLSGARNDNGGVARHGTSFSNDQNSLELGFWDLQFDNAAPGLSLVLHDYKHMEGLVNQATTKMPKIEGEIQMKQPPMIK